MPASKKDGTIWVNLQVPADIHSVVRHLSLDSGKSATDLYVGLIRQALGQRREEELRDA